jgi:acyl carrier protein
MDDVASKIIDILKKNMKSQPDGDITLDTPIGDLDIESLDLAVIVFDIEDTFGIEIPYSAEEGEGNADDFRTVGSVVSKVKELMA